MAAAAAGLLGLQHGWSQHQERSLRNFHVVGVIVVIVRLRARSIRLRSLSILIPMHMYFRVRCQQRLSPFHLACPAPHGQPSVAPEGWAVQKM